MLLLERAHLEVQVVVVVHRVQGEEEGVLQVVAEGVGVLLVAAEGVGVLLVAVEGVGVLLGKEVVEVVPQGDREEEGFHQ